jgi:PAS domain-containing protein
MISKDVQAVAVSSESVNTDAYNNSLELSTLSWSINSMLERLALNQEIAMQSTVSFNIVQNILNALDTYLFVADIETSNILFVNDKFKEHFGLTDDIIGTPCYDAISHCPKNAGGVCTRDYLLTHPEEVVVTEEELPATGRHYRKNDMIIDWAHGGKAYLHYSLDIL